MHSCSHGYAIDILRAFHKNRYGTIYAVVIPEKTNMVAQINHPDHKKYQ